MKSHILEKFKNRVPFSEIVNYSHHTQEKIPLFTPLVELANQNVYDFMKLHGKVYDVPFALCIQYQLINFNEVNSQGKSLMQLFIEADDFYNFSQLLLLQNPTKAMYDAASAQSNIGKLLRYRAGKNNPSVYECSTAHQRNNPQLLNLLYDYNDTTDEDSSDADIEDIEALSPHQIAIQTANTHQIVNTYNQLGQGAEKLSLMAARGVHFVPKHFPKAVRQGVHDTKKQSHITYSFSTLMDAGYEADDEPAEDDPAILATHQRNTQFIHTLWNSPDKKEQKTGHRYPPETRNNRVYENLFWREIQVYINSYDTLINLNGIQINFGFSSKSNPHLSLSWKIDKAGMYGVGDRFSWGKDIRRDPHYRRYDGKAKHPNMGYIDIFDFPLDYVRTHGIDRLLAYNYKKIDLSNLYLSEAEIIFHSMIPQKYHVRRYIVSLPSFDKPLPSPEDEKHFGVTKKAGVYKKAKNGLFVAIGHQVKKEAYHDWVRKRAEKAIETQSLLIDNAINARLFRLGKARAYNHVDKVSVELPAPNRL